MIFEVKFADLKPNAGHGFTEIVLVNGVYVGVVHVGKNSTVRLRGGHNEIFNDGDKDFNRLAAAHKLHELYMKRKKREARSLR